MSACRTFMVMVGAVCVSQTTAHATPKAKPIKAQMLCGTLVNGKIKQVLGGGKVAKLTEPVACAIHVEDPKEPSHMGNIHTVRYGTPKVVNNGKTDDFGADSAPGKEDFELVMKPDDKDSDGEIAFKPCEDFDIVGKISDDRGVYFTKTIKVQQTCPKPKPIAATVECAFIDKMEDGGGKHPLTGKIAERPQPEHLDNITCKVRSADKRMGESAIKASAVSKWTHVSDDGKHAPQTHEDTLDWMPGPASLAGYVVNFTIDDWDRCSDVDLVVTLADAAAGTTLFTKTVKTRFQCGE